MHHLILIETLLTSGKILLILILESFYMIKDKNI